MFYNKSTTIRTSGVRALTVTDNWTRNAAHRHATTPVGHTTPSLVAHTNDYTVNTRTSDSHRPCALQLIFPSLPTSNVTGRQQGPKRKLRVGYRAPSLKRTSHFAMRFHRLVWYRALSLRYACIRRSSIILNP